MKQMETENSKKMYRAIVKDGKVAVQALRVKETTLAYHRIKESENEPDYTCLPYDDLFGYIRLFRKLDYSGNIIRYCWTALDAVDDAIKFAVDSIETHRAKMDNAKNDLDILMAGREAFKK